MKKFLTLALSLTIMLTGCGAAGTATDEASETPSLVTEVTGLARDEEFLKVNDTVVDATMYLYWLNYTLNYFTSSATEYLDAETGDILWDTEIEDGYTVKQAILDETLNTVKMYMVVEQMAEEMNITLSETEENAITDTLNSMKEQLGGQEAFDAYMWDMGLDEATNLRFTRIFYLFSAMEKGTTDPESPLYITDETLKGFEGVTDDAILVDHILFTFVEDDEETNAELKTTMESLIQVLDETKEKGEDVTTVFDYFASQMSQDPGRTYYPQGYLLTPDAAYVQEFKDAAYELEEGEYSGIVESEYGYHLLLRKPLRLYFSQEYLNGLISEKMDAATVTFTDTYETFIETVDQYYKDVTAYLEENSAFDKVTAAAQDDATQDNTTNTENTESGETTDNTDESSDTTETNSATENTAS